MTTNQIMNLDCREESNCEVIQKCLRKIKPLAKCKPIEDIPFYKIERVITVLSKKYNMRVREFVPDVWSNEKETIWRAVIIDDRNLNQAGLVYGISVYEVFAKTAIWMYSIKDKVGERQGGK